MKKIVCLLFASLLVVACGYKEGTIQKSEAGYIEFTGSWEGATAAIDDLEPFVIGSGTGGKGGGALVYKLSTGKHHVRVYKSGELVVDRVIFLSSQSRLEVDIP